MRLRGYDDSELTMAARGENSQQLRPARSAAASLDRKRSPDRDLEHECFFIAPIGDPGSEERKRSDGVLRFIVSKAAAELGLKVPAKLSS